MESNQKTLVPGPSVIGTSILGISNSIPSKRNVTIVVLNYSHGIYLKNPKVYTYSGNNYIPPEPTIKPLTVEACAFSKTPGVAFGSVGVLTYDICSGEGNQACDRLAVMFSVPFNYDFYKNVFAIGKIDTSTECDESLFNKMYYRESTSFTRKNGTGDSVEFSKDGVTLKATMSPQPKSILKVEVWDT